MALGKIVIDELTPLMQTKPIETRHGLATPYMAFVDEDGDINEIILILED
tara:strand:- start:10485 stop:10634 length:150 start_codon:yes stop_codon:yes gene_type:complete